jgi:hypothetical protein
MRSGAIEIGIVWNYLLSCKLENLKNSEHVKGSLKNLKVQVSDTTMLK